MYNLTAFGSMISDEVRMQAYLKAMKKAITPGSIVLDIGTGTGVMAFFALKSGAKFVYAIESNDLIHIAEEMAQKNGLSSKMKFIKDLSTNISLEEKADVIVSDLRGALPLFGTHIPSIVDARTRLLKPGGIMIPLRDTLWASVVSSRKPYSDIVSPWEKYAADFDMSIAKRMSVNSYTKQRIKSSEVLTTPFKWTILDYSTIQSPNVESRFTRNILRSGIASGLSLWYDAELIKGVGFRNTPGVKHHPEVYGSTFFPFLNPVKVSKGDKIDIQIKANLVDDEYVWSWNTLITDRKGREIAKFEQSTFYSQRLSIAELKKNSLAYVPEINAEGEVDAFIIGSMNGKTSVEQIASRVNEKFPGVFKDVRDASARVSRLAKKYSK
jgi:type I protein arginine methyltransferase